MRVLLESLKKGHRSIRMGGIGNLLNHKGAEVITTRFNCLTQKADESSDTLGKCPTGISQREIGHN